MKIIFCGIFLPTKKRKQASKTPTPPGAAGTTKPKDHDKEKITNKRRQASKTPTPPGAAGTTKPKDHDKEKITNKNIMFRLLLA